VVFDTGGSVSGARDGVEALIRTRVVAIVGAATGEVSFAANKTLNENQMIMISAGSRRRLGDTGPYNFRNSLGDSDGVGGLVEWIRNNRPWKKFALFSSVVNDYSIQLNAIFKSELVKRKMNITHELYVWGAGMDNVNPEERGVGPQLKQMANNPPDAVVFTGEDSEAADLVREMRKMGIKIPVIGTEDMMTKAFSGLGDLAAGTVVFSGFDPDSKKPKTAAFVKAYTAKYKKAPTRMAALSYDSYRILAQALEKAESLRPSHMRKALMSVKDFDGVTGATSIGATREAAKIPFIFEMRKIGDGYGFVNVREGK
jgi:branched-chain amino acid transport system substrate-binding protein